MSRTECTQASDTERPAAPGRIASWGHLGGFLLIMAAMVAWGFHMQHDGMTAAESATPAPLANHSIAIRFYLVSIVANCLLFYYCWAGVHRHGGNLETLTGGRWTSWKALAIDVVIAVPFWIAWEAAAHGVSRLLGPSQAKSVDSLLPQSALETAVWIVVSIVAGFSEEIQTRGYLQRQFHAATGNVTAAILGQALVFGLAHSYLGWGKVVLIAVLGVLYGALAAWRRNLRVNIIAHAWSDIWEGWLKMVI